MLSPTKEHLSKDGGIWFCDGTRVHPNPRLYKYYWQVFTIDSEHEGYEFFKNAADLSIAAYFALIKQLRLEKKSAMIYNFKLLRHNHGLPLDMNHPRWKDLVMALSFEDDTDPLYQGHK